MKIVGKPENMSLSGDIRLDYRIIIKWILQKLYGRVAFI